MTEGRSTWKFPREFWVANVMELFERAAYYGCFIYLVVYLTRDVGFTDAEAGLLTGVFAFCLYFFPTFMGALADRRGFRSAIISAYILLAMGYGLLGAYPNKPIAVVSLTLIMIGGAINKPVISGTASKCSDEHNRARAFSIFYAVVNIGAFTGKAMVDPIRGFFRDDAADISGLQHINYYSSVCALAALVLALFLFRTMKEPGKGKSFKEITGGLGRVLKNFRFICLIIITGGFWAIQGQLYATMPKYLLRLVSDFAKPGWLANINPLAVIIFVVPITHLVRKIRPVSSIGIGLLIIPITALLVAMAPQLGSGNVELGIISLHPVTFMLAVAIAVQGIAECFLSPRYLEYASKQAPEGEVGLYMGYCHLNTAFAWLFGFALSGQLLERWCPDPRIVAQMPPEQAAHAYDHAHYIWYVFSAVGVVAFLALVIFRFITDRIDKKKAAAGQVPSA